jgi:hypothetical protein
MSAIPGFLDTSSKRWLAVLAAVFLASAAILAHSFLNASSATAENTITVEPKAARATEEPAARAEPAWDSLQATHEVEYKQPDGSRASPFAALDVKEARDNPVVIQARVHQQAEYLRKQIADGTLPKSLGNLTKEQVDEMEKKGVMIE